MALDVLKVFLPVTVSFFIGMAFTPILTHYLYKNKMWKKKARVITTDGREASIVNSINAQTEVNTPRMGGIIVWFSTIFTVFIFWLLFRIFPTDLLFEKLNFLSRNQTWLPLFFLLSGALTGLIDDYFDVKKTDNSKEGLSWKKRFLIIFVIGLVGAWWFFFRLGVSSIFVPFFGSLAIGYLFFPLFILVMFGIYAGGVIDGIDGLSGGVFSAIFSAYGLIAFFQNQIDLAALSFVIVGGLLAFLWFNIPPARFYMGETGSMSLMLTLTTIAFLTEQVVVLLIIASPLIVSAGSSALQLLSKKYRNGKKVFLAAPLHHHFQALGWPSYKVVMRYWVISVIVATIGVIIALLG
jgi:phospho-N-acetylmuramoyl-pentapeptide-transferase